MKIIIIALSIIFLSGPTFGEFYIWTDENGVKNFSNTAPSSPILEGTQVETLNEVEYDAEKDAYNKKQQEEQAQQKKQQEENEDKQKKLKELKAQKEQEKIEGKEAKELAEKQALEEEEEKRIRDAKESSKTARDMYIKKNKLIK
jgi:flagellar biosynthesis GTPase FlhF